MRAAVRLPHSASAGRRLAIGHDVRLVQHRHEDPRVSTGPEHAHTDIPGPPERSQRHQMGPARSSSRLVLR